MKKVGLRFGVGPVPMHILAALLEVIDGRP